MARRLAHALAVVLLGTLAALAHAQSLPPDQRQALNAAERWLEAVDAQRYANAWAMGAATLKGSVERKAFNDGMRDLRKDYGRVVLRKVAKMAYVGSPPAPEDGGPKEGAQISILFDTKFVRNRTATEEVMMDLEQDGLWRVAGYYIR